MKKFFAAVCCVLLVGGSVVAQEGVVTSAPVVVVAQEATPVAETSVDSVMEGQIISDVSGQSGCCGAPVADPCCKSRRRPVRTRIATRRASRSCCN